jgi:hypothetical protein
VSELRYWFGFVLLFLLISVLCKPEQAAREFGRAIRVFRAEVAAPVDGGAP